MLRFFRQLRKNESGATAIEYGLMAGLISIVIVSVAAAVGSKLNAVFFFIGTSLDTATSL